MADRIDTPDDGDASPGGTSPLVILARRWPLMLVGLAAGALLGVLIQISSTPVYQSSAQLLVVKKRAEFSTSDDRGMVDDYVGAQITIIKSEQVRLAAARELRKMPVQDPIPADDAGLAGVIGAGLGVARDRETALPGTIGNGIVILTMRGTNPADTKTYLEALVKAYQGVLTGVYNLSSREQLELSKKAIEADKAKLKELREERIKLEKEKNNITVEDVASVRSRVTSRKEALYRQQNDLVKVEEDLALIKKTGPNRRDRQDTLTRLTGDGSSGLRSLEQGIERQLANKKFEREVAGERYGDDHPMIRQLDREIKIISSEIERLNPADPAGILDELGAIEKQLDQRKISLGKQITALEKQLAEDERNLIAVAEISSQLDSNEAGIQLITADIARLDQQVRNAEVASGAGGYEANAVTPPGYGGQIAPKLMQSLFIGLAVGTLLGAAAVAIAELTDRSFRSPAEIRRLLNAPVIGHIPHLDVVVDEMKDGISTSIVSAHRPKSMEAEAYRGVRTQLYFSTQGRGHQVIQVTSPNPGDGKSTLAANLAVSIAQSGKGVVLIDCDFRKPRVHRIFGLGKPEVGVSSVVAGAASVARATIRSSVENLDLLPCGPRPDNPAELLTSPKFQELLAELRNQYEFVVVDTPPVLAVTDPTAVAPRVDGVILVFRMGKKSRPGAVAAREQLAAIGANVLGVVVNDSGTRGGGYGGYNYGTNYGYSYKAYEYSEEYTTADDEDDDILVVKRS